MRPRRLDLALAVALAAQTANAQSWRPTAEGLGNSARVLIIGTRPEDEDNALTAWFSLGHHVEVAYLSLTRGESGVNRIGTEQSWSLGVVRTAELLEERKRDGARQYFTRAFDFGPTPSDSIVDARWTHDVLLRDVVAVIRAFRPQIIISLFDTTDRDATHRVVARLTREAFAAAAHEEIVPSVATLALSPWGTTRWLTPVDSDSVAADGVIPIDVGELDRASGRSYAELGADIRALQRSQPSRIAPSPGHVIRYVRLRSSIEAEPFVHLFAPPDTFVGRFKGVVPDKLGAILDSLLDGLKSSIAEAQAVAAHGTDDEGAVVLARVYQQANEASVILSCQRAATGIPACAGARSDLAATLDRIRRDASSGAIEAAHVIIDATVERERVATGDPVPVTVTIRNGGNAPLVLRNLTASSLIGVARPLVLVDSALMLPDSILRFTASLGVGARVGHWWQRYGLIEGTSLELLSNVPVMMVGPTATQVAPTSALAVRELVTGEDRLASSGVEGTLTIGGVDVQFVRSPLVYRAPTDLRGDDRHALAGVTPLSPLLESGARYDRAGLPITRLFPVTVTSVRASPETVTVTVTTPKGLKVDTAVRHVLVPPYGTRAVYFGLSGKLAAATDTVNVQASFGTSTRAVPASSPLAYQNATYDYGIVSRDYPHIPTQHFFHAALQRLEVVDLKVPPQLRVAYLTTNANDDLSAALSELKIEALPIQPALLAVADLTPFTTVLIAPNATSDESFAVAAPALRAFMLRGGTVVALSQGPQLLESGILPYPIAFDSLPLRVTDPSAPIATDPKSTLFSWPNRITAADWVGWSGDRARNVPSQFEAHYKSVLLTSDPGQPPASGALLITPVGKGTFIYSALSLDRQLVAIHAGGARLLANLLSAGLERLTPKK